MEKERSFLKMETPEVVKEEKKLFLGDPFGLTSFSLAVVFGLILGSITIPRSAKGFDGPCFSLGTTGGVLIGCLLFGHFGRLGKLSLKIPENTLKVLKEFGLMFFLLGAGFHGGVSLVEQVSNYGAGIVLWGLIGGAVMTIAPLIVGYILAKKEAKNAPQKSQDYSLMTSLVYLIVSSVLVAFVLLMAWCAILLISGDISFM